MVTRGDPYKASPEPAEGWVELSDADRKRVVQMALDAFALDEGMERSLPVLLATKSGVIEVETPDMNPAERGTVLLNAENYLQITVDPALLVYLRPTLDRNPLRKLRGVTVHEWRQE